MAREQQLQPWWPSDWTSKSAWLESAHRAARVLRRDVAHATPQQLRQAIDVASLLNPGPWGGDYSEVTCPEWSGAEVTWKERSEGTVVWVHGGAFAFGSPRVYRAAAVHLARASRCRVLLPSYRLAPEHPFPAAHDDVFQALESILSEGDEVVIVGDSAGGNLVLGALQKMSRQGDLSNVAGVALLSPWCDLRKEAESIRHNDVSHSPFDSEDSLAYSRQYLAGHPADDPLVSPILMKGSLPWPPVYMEWAEDEFLAPDVQLLRDQIRAAQPDFRQRTEPAAVHGWQTLPDVLPEGKRSSEALGAWVREKLGLPASR